MEIVTLGAGCFRCTQAAFQLIKGIQEAHSGYMGGERPNPSYEQVSTGVSGHREVVQVYFDPTIISYKQILEIFFTIHNPTQVGGQGNDKGDEYSSVIYYHDDTQKNIATACIQEREESRARGSYPIVTELRPAQTFWLADEYHQNYYTQNTDQPYCQIVINPKLEKLRKKYADLLK